VLLVVVVVLLLLLLLYCTVLYCTRIDTKCTAQSPPRLLSSCSSCSTAYFPPPAPPAPPPCGVAGAATTAIVSITHHPAKCSPPQSFVGSCQRPAHPRPSGAAAQEPLDMITPVAAQEKEEEAGERPPAAAAAATAAAAEVLLSCGAITQTEKPLGW
jgi:hypothetical protein